MRNRSFSHICRTKVSAVSLKEVQKRIIVKINLIKSYLKMKIKRDVSENGK